MLVLDLPLHGDLKVKSFLLNPLVLLSECVTKRHIRVRFDHALSLRNSSASQLRGPEVQALDGRLRSLLLLRAQVFNLVYHVLVQAFL